MEHGSCSRCSWADEVEEEEAAQGGTAFLELPRLATAAHAELVLRSSSLDPGATPYLASPGGSAGRVHLSNFNASLDDSNAPPPCATSPQSRRRSPPRRILTALLRRAQEPPASSRMRACTHLLELIVVPRTPALQAAEDALSLALLALVIGTRPLVTPAMAREHLAGFFGITDDRAMVCRTRPDDFIVRFTRQEDLELVVSTPHPARAPFTLRWWRWSRLIMGSPGAFRFRVLVGLKGIPSHARSKDTAQTILGSSCTNVDIANLVALVDPDDECELFVAAWCAHPDLIPDEKIMAVPKPEEEHDGSSPLYLRPHEIIHDEVPVLRYLVRLRLIEFQD
ncbi:uncharacterized protein [Miscanthus floridulus]|uniref:uncharacterized protein n=1 Tax=Miscanthus floridulus TaxID=154761 RepID=UPI003459FFEF